MIPAFLNPKSVFHALDAIDQTPPSHTAPRAEGSRVTLIVLFSTAIALLVLNYCKNSYVLDHILVYWAKSNDLTARHYIDALAASGWGDMTRYVWWTGWHVVTYIILPFVVITFFLKKTVQRFWLGLG